MASAQIKKILRYAQTVGTTFALAAAVRYTAGDLVNSFIVQYADGRPPPVPFSDFTTREGIPPSIAASFSDLADISVVEGTRMTASGSNVFKSYPRHPCDIHLQDLRTADRMESALSKLFPDGLKPDLGATPADREDTARALRLLALFHEAAHCTQTYGRIYLMESGPREESGADILSWKAVTAALGDTEAVARAKAIRHDLRTFRVLLKEDETHPTARAVARGSATAEEVAQDIKDYARVRTLLEKEANQEPLADKAEAFYRASLRLLRSGTLPENSAEKAISRDYVAAYLRSAAQKEQAVAAAF